MKTTFCLLIGGLIALIWGCDMLNGKKRVENGSRVSVEYTLSDGKGEVIESNKGKAPMEYTQGEGQIIPGLEKELAGMAVGDEKKVNVKAEDAYGPVDPAAFREMPREKIPADGLKVGTQLMVKTAEGQSFAVRVHEVKDKTVVLDMNHPLAGKALSFEIKILSIEQPEKK
jgi:FKBP-type peptidyl-prolyl cis-trans isomerase 2